VADQPIDINSKRKDSDKNDALRDQLQLIFTQIVRTEEKLRVRIEDLNNDATELRAVIEGLIGDLYTRFPELEPKLDEEETE
jgi:hypothetical protein